MTDYYAVEPATHLDGTLIFLSPDDRRVEGEIAARVAEAWRCEIHPFGALSPLDWFATRDGRVVGVIELKARSHAVATYPTVFLNVRKWLALSLAATGLGTPAVFVVRFTDALMYARVGCAMGGVRIGGARREGTRAGLQSAQEPVIEVPVAAMRAIGGAS